MIHTYVFNYNVYTSLTYFFVFNFQLLLHSFLPTEVVAV